MPDPATMIIDAISLVNKLLKLHGKAREAEIKNVIADLQIALADTKIAVAELKNENLRLRNVLETSAATSITSDDIELRGDAYYRKQAPVGKPKGPFCVNCFDSNRNLVVLTKMASTFHVICTHRCPQCQNKVTLE